MNSSSSAPAFEVIDLGLVDYQAAWDIQKQHHTRVASGGRPTLLLAEHPAVLTLGRKAQAGENIVVTREYLAAQGIGVHEIERGGDVTYHGPGQLVIYAIFPVGRKVRDFLRLLEEVTLQALAALNLRDTRPNPGYAGIYVPDREVSGLMRHQKIASIGVAIKRHVALHGVGLNVSTHLDHFDLIVPCGLADTQMTSIEREYQLREMGRVPDMNVVKQAVTEAFAETFRDYDWTLPVLPFQNIQTRPIPSVGGPA